MIGLDLVGFFKPTAVVFKSIASKGHSERHADGCPVYLVNPKGGESDLFLIYRDLDEIEGHIDLALIRTAPATVIKLIEQCGRRGSSMRRVFSSGFCEVGG